MPEPTFLENEFLNQLSAVIENNISNEQFGVSELAEQMNMSRSNLLRRVKKDTNLSVSQLISQVRLNRAMELLKKGSLNVSEVSDQVGFNSTSYFIKCFREYYGYPPGEVGKREEQGLATTPAVESTVPGNSRKKRMLGIAVAVGITIAAALLIIFNWPASETPALERSIAVLPFKNDSADSTNVYLINGLMESTLSNLQQIKDLKVISRTSSEKYRNSGKSIPEMAKELNVNYFVEGSGQKIGDEILLHIQLIEASTDRHLWAKRYKREATDIFELQQEIAKNIVEEIQGVITPAEAMRIGKKPTDDLLAYDHYLKGLDLMHVGTHESYEEAITWFQKAIDQDGEFALAYAESVLAFYLLDVFQANKKYTEEISAYADKAVLYDPKLAESLVAKGIAYIQKKEYGSAEPYLEKALEYNPNSMLAITFLTDFYHNNVPNTKKYLHYALKGVRLAPAAHDSASTSYSYLRLSNALLQTGFLDEALVNINKSLEYNPKNPYSHYVKIFIHFAMDGDIRRARDLLIKEIGKDTTRFDIMQEVGKLSYFMKDYTTAYRYYERFINLRDSRQMDVYKHENLKVAFVLEKTGHPEKSKEFLRSFKAYADNDRSIYKHLNLTVYYAYTGDEQKAIEHLRKFSEEDDYLYWVLFWEIDPASEPLMDNAEFVKIMKGVEEKFWKSHKKIRAELEEENLI